MNTSSKREMKLEDMVRDLHKDHTARRQLMILNHCRSHPFQWFLWDLKTQYLNWFSWSSPVDKELDLLK